MSENLASRVKRLVSGSVNSLVDAVENASPDMVMAEAIREIDRATDEMREELGRVLAGKHLASRRLMDANGKHEALTEQIETAVQQGRDDLAEAAISRQMDIESQIPVLETAIGDANAEEAKLEGYIQALQARRREMNEDLDAFKAAKAEEASAIGEHSADTSGGTAQKVSNAERAFDRAMRNTTGVPATGAARPQDAAKLAELEALSRQNRIRERLAAVKAGESDAS